MALLKILQWLPLLTQDKSQSSDDGFKALHHFHQTSSFPSFTVSYATPATLASFIANHWGHSCLKPLVIPCVPSSPYLKLQNLHRLNTLHQQSIPFPSSLFSIALRSEYNMNFTCLDCLLFVIFPLYFPILLIKMQA